MRGHLIAMGLSLRSVLSICPLQQSKEEDNSCNGIKVDIGAFHNTDGTSEVGSYGSKSFYKKSIKSLNWESSGMGAVERAGMSRPEQDAIKTGKSEKIEEPHSLSESPTAVSENEMISKLKTDEINQEAPNKTTNSSGTFLGSKSLGAFDTEDTLGARSASWKSGDGGKFGSSETLDLEGNRLKNQKSGAFGDGELFNSEEYLASRGMHISPGNPKMAVLKGSLRTLSKAEEEIKAEELNELNLRKRMIREGIQDVFRRADLAKMYEAMAREDEAGARNEALAYEAMKEAEGRAMMYGAGLQRARKAAAMQRAQEWDSLASQRRLESLASQERLNSMAHSNIYRGESMGNRLSVNGHREEALINNNAYLEAKYSNHGYVGNEALYRPISDDLNQGFARERLHSNSVEHFY